MTATTTSPDDVRRLIDATPTGGFLGGSWVDDGPTTGRSPRTHAAKLTATSGSREHSSRCACESLGSPSP